MRWREPTITLACEEDIAPDASAERVDSVKERLRAAVEAKLVETGRTRLHKVQTYCHAHPNHARQDGGWRQAVAFVTAVPVELGERRSPDGGST